MLHFDQAEKPGGFLAGEGISALKERGMPENILVADDDVDMRKVYARIFSGTGYSFSIASSVAEASALMEANAYDLLVTDLELEDGLGTELIALFGKKKPAAKSLLVTGSTKDDGVLGRCGAFACFEKPFRIEAFLSAVRRALAN
jgi:DNA-binding NtrC family response regulator